MGANCHVVMYNDKIFRVIPYFSSIPRDLFHGGFLHLVKLPVNIVFALPVLSVSLNEVKCFRQTSRLPCTGSVFL